MTNVLPGPERWASTSRPWWLSRICRAIVSPSPEPSENWPEPRWKRSKIRSRSSSAIPGPSSRTATQAQPCRKVQSALLEAMAERQVSIGGTTYPVPVPFLVLATQNPIETEGVYALPEAQRDRFLIKVDVDHAEELDELAILHRMSVAPPRAHQVLTVEELVALQTETDQVFVHPAIAHYIVQLVMATRHPHRFGLQLAGVLEYGVSARGTLGLVAAARALALLRGRDYVLPNDVAALAGDVLAHRLVMSFDAVAEGVDPRSIISSILNVVPRPRVAPEDDEIAGVAA
jgi:MoxR-like ATPase